MIRTRFWNFEKYQLGLASPDALYKSWSGLDPDALYKLWSGLDPDAVNKYQWGLDPDALKKFNED